MNRLARKYKMTPIHALRLSLVALASMSASSSFAQDSAYYYGGLSIGQSQATIDEQGITSSLLAAGLASTSMSKDESDTAYKLFGGYQFNRNFAIEAGFFDLGSFGYTVNTTPTGTLNGRIKIQGINLDLVGTLPVSERLSVIGRIGAQGARSRDTFSATGAVGVANANPRENEVNYKLGLGLQYEWSNSFFVRAEAERYRINDAIGNLGDVTLYSVSLVFPFGRAPAAAPRPVAAAAPAYVAPAPAPAAAPAPMAPPAIVAAPEPRRVSFSADSLFEFNASDVGPDGKVALDELARNLNGTQFDVITVEGHTDRLGSPAYNQQLSMRRAQAVKAYLVNTGGMDANKVQAIGKGESTPVTRPGDCKDGTPRASLIACLRADRRVDVNVTGTR